MFEIKVLSIINGTEKTIAIVWDREAAFEYAETMKSESFVTIYKDGEWIANIG